MTALEKLLDIAADLREGKPSPQLTTRRFLASFGAQRRGYWIVESIRNALSTAGLTTVPDFESAYIDADISFRLNEELYGGTTNIVYLEAEAQAGVKAEATLDVATRQMGVNSRPYTDPTHSISKLEAANTAPTKVTPNSSVEEAVTLMLAHDFSQLPVMVGDREIKGVVSWQSIGARLALRQQGKEVREFMEAPHEIRSSASLFSAVPVIVENNYVLVRGIDGRITGIVTATDLSLQFQQLAQPFLLLGEIENHIRNIIGSNFNADELVVARDPGDDERTIESVADLTFGEYIRLLENPDRWARLSLQIDRSVFCKQLDQIRRVRNDVMHFDPDGIAPDDHDLLINFARFLGKLQNIGAR